MLHRGQKHRLAVSQTKFPGRVERNLGRDKGEGVPSRVSREIGH